MSLLSRLLRSEPQTRPAPPPLHRAQPQAPLYVVGDIHGRDDLLGPLLRRIHEDAAGKPHDLVFVGDYVDRGDQSAVVMARLFALRTQPHVTFLLGNHEKMMLDFLDDPEGRAGRWFRYGGLQTLASFGIGGVTETAPSGALRKARDAFRKALGPVEAWLRGLDRGFVSGNVAVVHAALDPALPLDAQNPRTLIWGHPEFGSTPRRDGLWVVHGHSIVERPKAEGGVVSIDTGAYASGRLTAAAIGVDGTVRFLTSEG